MPQAPRPASPGSIKSRKRRKKKEKSPRTIRVFLARSEEAQDLPFGRTTAAREPFVKTRTPSTATGQGLSLLFGFPQWLRGSGMLRRVQTPRPDQRAGERELCCPCASCRAVGQQVWDACLQCCRCLLGGLHKHVLKITAPWQLHLPSPCLSSTHLCQLLGGGPASSYPPRALPMSLSPACPPRDQSQSSHSTSHCNSPSFVMETNQPQTSSVPLPPAWLLLQMTAVKSARPVQG